MIQWTGKRWCLITPAFRKAVVLLAVFWSSLSLQAQSSQPVVLFTGHLNNDCYPDTVRGFATDARTYLPDMIVWGKPNERNPQQCDRDSTRGGHPKEARIMPTTSIGYPDWRELQGSVAFEQYNTNDEVTDMILYLWGKSPQTGKDTARVVVVYGQVALDTLPVLMIGSVTSGTQTAPFFAMDLTVGRQFVDPAVRDVGGQTSFELPRVQFALREEEPVQNIAPQQPGMTATVTAYPNPAELWTRLESSPLEAGQYTITVMAVNGSVYHTQLVDVSRQGQISEELNLNDLPSGYYVVRLHRAGEYISSYPIVIVR